ncbi:MAG: zinc ribbon domain-containing protein [Erysipelotrichaceae bacterium]|nr:zinc ribbon domain-containing protein [Erysipelotrichaceae bacterium]
MKLRRIIGFILGAALIYFSVGAYFSDEPASKTDIGRIMAFVAGAFGLLMVISNLFATKTPQVNQAVVTQASDPIKVPCPVCQQPIDKTFHHCPHCGINLHPLCPSCSRNVSPEFKVCPYCATKLKDE